MWFWRGTQSAIFYYVSLSPCFEYNHKRKRRKEATRVRKERAGLDLSQPGIIHQPVPFQTNQHWAEEIEAGPGPPHGWKKHSLDHVTKRAGSGRKMHKKRKKSVFAPTPEPQQNDLSALTPSSSDSAPPLVENPPARPSLRASAVAAGSTLDALKDTLKSTIARPDAWNWKRYEREDETLFGINDRLSRMWDRATHHGRQSSTDRGRPTMPGRRRADTADSDDHSWLYARNPGVNDLHPPTVSQLPRTEREVAWMMQPPPSRDVMEGKVRPDREIGNRRPLCRIEGIPVHPRKPGEAEARRTTAAPTTADMHQAPDIPRSWDGMEYANTAGEGAGGNDEAGEDDETEEGVFPDQDYLSSQSHTLRSLSKPRDYSPPRRPPLAILVDSKSPNRFQSYQFPLPSSPKAIHPRSASPCQSPEMDVLMGVVLPQMPARSRYSMPM